MQHHYNLAYREEEREMIPLCRDQGVALVPWSGLARGFLAGTRDPGRSESRRSPRARTDDVADKYYGRDSDHRVLATLTAGRAPCRRDQSRWWLFPFRAPRCPRRPSRGPRRRSRERRAPRRSLSAPREWQPARMAAVRAAEMDMAPRTGRKEGRCGAGEDGRPRRLRRDRKSRQKNSTTSSYFAILLPGC
ncbi:aldo/keto reductase [Nocardia sp. NEAU-351]|uniref:Aldo/keto reductase n=2 Tax=Nocardia bovistercoris TaxID=2785916 RepID=A0A931N1W3_9NOCA|nr:aldo/keto reductase [Nocardia bovistercoris]MBH0776329.1 aldo/keto reductase [Nocardia bovistercoris]